MKIGLKLIIGFFFMILLLLIAAGTGWYGITQLGVTLQGIKRTSGNSNLAAEIATAAKSAEAKMLRYIRTVDPKIFTGLQTDNKTMLDKAQELENSVKRDVMKEYVKQVKPLVGEFETAVKAVHDNAAQRDKADKERRETGLKLTKAIQDLRDYLNEFANRNSDKKSDAFQHLVWLESVGTQRESAGRFVRDVQILLDADGRNDAENKRIASMDTLYKDLKEMLDKPLNDEEKALAATAQGIAVTWGEQGKVFKGLTDALFSAEAGCEESIGKIVKLANDMSANTAADITARVQAADSQETSLALSILAVACFSVLIGIVVAVVLTRNITVGTKHVTQTLKTITDEGDLSIEIDADLLNRKDEIGLLGNAVHDILRDYQAVEQLAKELADRNWTTSIKAKGEKDAMNLNLADMIDKINATLHEIDNSVQQVATGSDEVSSASQALSSGAQESAASLEEITASMQEISSQTKSNAENAGQARDLAHLASKAATDGQGAMQEMTSAMDRITKNSAEIQRVIKVIDDIAFQTNLLALNAAVEAARAGQQGKGFAVVAEEVRNLATRSAKAAQETSELIAKSGHEIERGAEVASRTAEMLNTIVEQVKQTTDIVAGIAIASNEQAQGVNQVSIGLQQIDSVTQQNTASAEESASAAAEMSSMAANLLKLVAQFKLRT